MSGPAKVQAFAYTNGAPPVLDAASLHILRHALGLSNGGIEYRNHFVTGPGSKDYAACMALVESGFMRRRDGSPLTGGDDLFTVTDAGKAVARAGGCAVKPVGEILHGNADLTSESGQVAAIAQGAKVYEQAMDLLTGPELTLAERQYSDRLSAIPVPDAPAPEPLS